MKFLGILSELLLTSTFIAGALAGSPAATIAITGVQNNGIQPRVELRTMQQQNPDQFNVYLLALRYFQSQDESEQLSHYGIAGIHGRPFKPWDGETSAAGANGYGGGYCTHASNIFLTWHRPYLALYEQTLYNVMQNIVLFFPSSSLARYQAAAKNFRLPYWDWAAPPCSGCQPFPVLVSNQFTTVDTPTGSQQIENPLYQYDFKHDLSSDFPYPLFASWTSTKRAPTTQDSTAQSNDASVASQIANARQNLADRVYNLLTNANYDFNSFSNEALVNGQPPTQDSLESVHDAIHSITGTGGHMTYLEYSAHDPVFFLHHANIDRLWAIWSFTHSGSYVVGANSQQSTYVWNVGTYIDQDTGLSPFHSDTHRTFWTSRTVRDPTVFSYTYPEIQNGATNASVNTAINALYGSSASSSKRKRDDNSTLPANVTLPEGAKYQYIANFESYKFENNGSYAIYLFLGDVSENYSDWATAQNLVGTHAISSSLTISAGGATNDSLLVNNTRPDVLVTGQIPVTNSLQDDAHAGLIPDLELETVSPYLQSNLTWRVALYDGTIIPPGQMNLSVKVYATEYTPPATPADMPTWGNSTQIPDITGGQVACPVVYVEADE